MGGGGGGGSWDEARPEVGWVLLLVVWDVVGLG